MLANDIIGIELDNGVYLWTKIGAVLDADTLTINDAIPVGRTAPVDNKVVTHRWDALPVL